jgi:hypothetical protein
MFTPSGDEEARSDYDKLPSKYLEPPNWPEFANLFLLNDLIVIIITVL